MLDSFIIDELKRRERAERPYLDLPLPEPRLEDRTEKKDERGDGGTVIIIPIGGE